MVVGIPQVHVAIEDVGLPENEEIPELSGSDSAALPTGALRLGILVELLQPSFIHREGFQTSEADLPTTREAQRAKTNQTCSCNTLSLARYPLHVPQGHS